MRSPTVLLALATLSGSACFDLGQGSTASGDGSTDAAAIGAFAVEASLASQTCGSGSLALAEALSFSVTVGESDGVLTWGQGDASLRGDLDADGVTFELASATVVDMRQASEENLPPCSIRRTDRVRGAFDDAEDKASFSAELELAYEPTDGSDCRDLLFGPERLVQALPCGARYELRGEQSE
jgi:hypothetical protein